MKGSGRGGRAPAPGAPTTKGHARDARALAAEVLRKLEADPAARLSELLHAMLGGLADGRDRALTTELAYGVTRWRRRLDAALDAFMPRGIGSVEPMARALLRVGAYQLGWLDRVPKEIAVSATQDAARTLGLGRLTGLLNAVLRKVAAAPEALPAGSSDAAIAVRASLPEWVVTALRERFGDAVEAEAMALRARPLVTLRPTLGKGGASAARAALEAEGLAVRDAEHGLLALAGGDAFATDAARRGLFVAQDPSGAIVVDAVAAACGVPPGGSLAGLRVLDLCAGRGVKTTALLDRGARVVAVDVARGKLDELVRVAARLGVEARLDETLALDAAAAESEPALTALGSFDAVLVDAPCTGLGTLRRHPEIVWRVGPDDVRALAALQRRLVAAGAARVKPGGGLIYAVCSFVRAEGEVSLPSPFEETARVDVAPSSGLDAFQVRRFARRQS